MIPSNLYFEHVLQRKSQCGSDCQTLREDGTGVSRQRKLRLLMLKKYADETFDHLNLYVHRVRFSAGLGRLLKT